jgi:hypothetical protein
MRGSTTMVLGLLLAGCASSPPPVDTGTTPDSARARAPEAPMSDEERGFGSKVYRQDGLVMRHRSRAPEGMAAFYLGRGFPKVAVDEARRACFISVYVRNERPDKVWFDLGRWTFTDRHGRPVRRLTREHWNATWERRKVPMRSRATFGWTLVPEERDLHISEPVAGNITLVPVDGPIRVTAEFPTGENREGPVIRVRFEGLTCVRDPS